MTPSEFVSKWREGGDERRDFHSFFNDLCRMLGHKTPREADPTHTWFTFEYGASKSTGGQGWADVWKRGHFGLEAKGTGRDLVQAYAQLKAYSDALQNPPLLIVTDMQRFEIHTNFTNAVKHVHHFSVDDLLDLDTRRLLAAAFNDPAQLRPGLTRQDITQDAAGKFADLAQRLRHRGHEPHTVATFLTRLIFCAFAEDIGLLPEQVFTRMIRSVQDRPDQFESRAGDLFGAMQKGGDFALVTIDWFNGGLFQDAAALPLDADDLAILSDAVALDWSQIDPSILGTLFERGLDPAKRSQLGAHYTDPNTIDKIIGPVIVDPLLAEWEETKGKIEGILAKTKTKTKVPRAAQQTFNTFLERMREFRVLDPACGSGNFLYTSLRALKDVEHRVIWEGEALGLGRQVPAVGPANVMGIEINIYAAELARLTVWIGEIQWMIQNGHGVRREPILQELGGIETRDALVNPDGSEAKWPAATVIVGNPPFIGNRKMVSELGRAYSDSVRDIYEDRVPRGADFVCYWFAKADDSIRAGKTQRAGLVSTHSIKGGASRKVLDRVLEHSPIFSAWSDLPWVNEGANVRVSIICFGHSDQPRRLNSLAVESITSSLVELVDYDIATAAKLRPNTSLSFQGVTPRGELRKKQAQKLGLPPASFTLSDAEAHKLLMDPKTLHGTPLSAVVRPYLVADDITTRPSNRFIVNFGTRDEAEASTFGPAYDAVSNVRLHRQHMSDADEYPWWQLWRPRPKMTAAAHGLHRIIAIPRVAKHHLCAWTPSSVTHGDALVIVARDDDTSLGILQSHIHGYWALRMGTRFGATPRYTPGTCFETFPFPEGLTPDTPATDFESNPRAQSIAKAARALTEARDRWLNPPEWVDWVRTSEEVAAGFPARPVAKVGHESELKKRTLTNLYNARPAWLASLHDALDAAVAAAYGWEWPMTDDEILRRVFELNQERSG